MPGLTLCTSNRLESLCDRLAERVREPQDDPFRPETVMVQSRGMERWLRLELATRLGCCANFRFPFPNVVLADVFSWSTGGSWDPEAFGKGRLLWLILRLLGEVRGRAGFEGLDRYLGNGTSPVAAYQLAARIADVFDQYLIYRPRMILRWQEEGSGGRWQGDLWRMIVEEAGTHRTRAELGRDFVEGKTPGWEGAAVPASEEGAAVPASEPKEPPYRRLSVFGVSVIPLFHLEILNAFAQHAEVDLYFLNPSREYWSEIVSEGRAARLLRSNPFAEDPEPEDRRDLPTAESQWLDSANPLLASLGPSGADFFRFVYGYEPVVDDRDEYVEPGRDTMLHALQSDILHLRDGSAGGTPQVYNDSSVVVASCHSPLREAEALHDYLLQTFDEMSELDPGDVLVLTTDIDTYGPAIESVFGEPEHEDYRIPFSVADRAVRSSSDVVRAFLQILDLADSRFERSRVLALLDQECVRRRLDLGPADTQTVREWVTRVHIAWGVDREQREEVGVPGFAENTWKAGMDRLFLGYAMGPGEETRLYHSILPFDDLEGSDGDILARLSSLYRSIRELRAGCRAPRPVDAWVEWLNAILTELLSDDEEYAADLAFIRDSLHALVDRVHASGFDDEVGLQMIRACVQDICEGERLSSAFLTGRVTVCAMQPMRSIPARVVCVLGLSDGAFPRSSSSRRPGFDLVARHPARGDRSLPREDRYLFLETLLSARDRLYFSYVGQSIEDNSEIPPAVVLGEVLDYLDGAFAHEKGSIRETVVRRHPLQAFSPRYFRDDTPLVSHSRENYEGARAVTGPRDPDRRFCPAPLPDAPVEPRIPLSSLERFLTNPARHFCRSVLGIRLEDAVAERRDSEPFLLDNLERYHLGGRILADPARAPRMHPELRAEGVLPHGTMGRLAWDEVVGEVDGLLAQLTGLDLGEAVEDRSIEMSAGPSVLYGSVSGVHGGGVVTVRFAKVRAEDRLRGWLHHLVAHPLASYVVGRSEAVVYEGVSDPAPILDLLVRLYLRGSRRPLPLIPRASLASAEGLAAGRDAERCVTQGRRAYETKDDPWEEICWGSSGGVAVDAPEFLRIAEQVFAPLLACERRIEA